MKKTFFRKKLFTAMILSALFILMSVVFIACNNTDLPNVSKTGTEASNTQTQAFGKSDLSEIWSSALYKEDTILGDGVKTVKVEVKAGDNSVTFTIRTNKDYLKDALLEHNLIEGEESAYGMLIQKVNGITADYDVDKAYWGFYKDGALMNTGADAADINGNGHYEFVYTK